MDPTVDAVSFSRCGDPWQGAERHVGVVQPSFDEAKGSTALRKSGFKLDKPARYLTFAGMRLFLALSALAMVIGSAHAAPGFCRARQDDKAERAAPAALLPRMARTFGVAPEALRGGSFVRCSGGRLMGCIVGANLNCGRANIARTSAGGDAFCRDSLGSQVVPLAATGHDTIYEWHCEGDRAVAGQALETVDQRGFTAANWRLLR